MARKGEFESRDRDESTDLSGIPLAGLGELPEELSDERGDLRTYQTGYGGAGAADMVGAEVSRVDASGTGLGTPKIDFDVRSIYDSRPINSQEFNLWFTLDVTAEPPATISPVVLKRTFQVPQGRVCVLQEVTIYCPNMTPINAVFDGAVGITVDDAIVDPPDIETGPDTLDTTIVQENIIFRDGTPIRTFVIADQGQFVGLILELLAEGVVELTTFNVAVGFRGQFLQKTGCTSNFQIANPAGRAQSAVTSSAADLRGPPDSSGMVVKRRRKVPFGNVPIVGATK